jgi:hypothetical protein
MLVTQVFGRVDKKSLLVLKGITFTLLDLMLIILSFNEQAQLPSISLVLYFYHLNH